MGKLTSYLRRLKYSSFKRTLSLGQQVAALFANSEVGVWYDPSDFSTMFQDSAGTTPVTAVEQPVGLILDKSGRGNHASQATTTKRPVLSARYNLLTKTEDFSDAAWTKNGDVAQNAVTDPLGGNTAETLTATAALCRLYQQPTLTAASHVFSIWAKRISGTSQFALSIDGLAFSNISLTTEWQQFTLTQTASAGTNYPQIRSETASGDVIAIWGASLVPSNQASLPYQRVNTATDYDTVGFKPYLKFDGIDDALATSAIDFSATDKMSVWAGVTKLSDGGAGDLIGYVGSNSPYVGVPGNPPASSLFTYGSGGSVMQYALTTDAQYAAPKTVVFTGQGDISGDIAKLRLNGVQVSSVTADQGTGNYANAAVHIGARNSTSIYFNGNLYSLIIRGAASTAAQITNTESWVATKTGVTL